MSKSSYCTLQPVISFNREDSPVCGLVRAQVFHIMQHKNLASFAYLRRGAGRDGLASRFDLV
jgi:hypothetical protein